VSEFDPDVAEWGAFVRTVVDRELTSISRQKNLKRRGNGKKPLSINVLVPGEDGPIELAQLLGPWHQDAVTGRDRQSNVQEFERTLDVQELVRQLPDGLRQLAERLQQQKISDIAREMGIPRTTLLRDVQRIREFFESHHVTKER
jgi:DNA-directed RNA polymerase specialized sigma24 family protein